MSQISSSSITSASAGSLSDPLTLETLAIDFPHAEAETASTTSSRRSSLDSTRDTSSPVHTQPTEVNIESLALHSSPSMPHLREMEDKCCARGKEKMKVLLMEGIHASAVEVLEKAGFAVEQSPAIPEDQLLVKIRDAVAIGVRSKTKLTKRVLDAAKELMCVGCFCIGTDQTEVDYAAIHGIPVFNAPFANTRSVAEMVISELIMLARQVGDRNKEMHAKTFNKSAKNCFEVRGKTLGIVGYGHVGSQVSIMAEALGMHVLFYDIVQTLALGTAEPMDSLDELLKQSDFVTLHVPGTPLTYKMIGERQVRMMKKGSYLLNAARGDVVDVSAVAAALKSGHLAGAAFDVFPYEPATAKEAFNSDLQNLNNVILTPHIGGSTEEAQAAIGREVALKIRDFIQNGTVSTSVNFPDMQLRVDRKYHRIINVHHNVPGVLKSINSALSFTNVSQQLLMTRGPIGVLLVDVQSHVSEVAQQKMAKLKESIRTRIVY